jgi:hypothetical protein
MQELVGCGKSNAFNLSLERWRSRPRHIVLGERILAPLHTLARESAFIGRAPMTLKGVIYQPRSDTLSRETENALPHYIRTEDQIV